MAADAKTKDSEHQKSDGDDTAETMTTTVLAEEEYLPLTEEDLEFEKQLILFKQRLEATSMLNLLKK